MRSCGPWISVAACIVLSVGCSESATSQPARVGLAELTHKAQQQPAKESKEQRKERKGKRQTPIYVDGKYAGELRFRELPPELKISWHPLDHGYVARRFAFADYLAAVGIPLAKVKALHLYGGRSRVLVIDGDELRRTGKAAQFQFTKSTSGNPQWKHDGPINANTSIDKIRGMAVYVERDAPELRHGKLYVDGKRVDGYPYVKQARQGGTRIYLDGRLVANVKRRDVEEGGKVLGQLLASLDVDIKKVKSAELVSRDQIASEFAGARLGDDALALGSAERSHGRFTVAGIANGEPIDAVLLYAKALPPDRDGPSPHRPDTKDSVTKDATRSSAKGLSDDAKDIGG